MNIYVHKDGKQLGPYDEVVIKAGLESGAFSSTDSGWHEGLSKWCHLGSMVQGGGHQPPPPPPAPSAPEVRASLVCIAGPDAGKKAELLSGKPFTIGRAADCHCVSADAEVREHHVTLIFDHTQATLEASGGAKFVVNGEESSRGVISSNQQVRIGWSYWQLQLQTASKLSAGAVIGKVVDKISAVAGVDRIEGLSGSELLGSILKRRTDDEVEELFIAGTKRTTPPLTEVNTRWPKPWAFFKCIIASVILTGGFYWGLSQYQNSLLVAGLVFAGSFGMPFSAVIFFVEMNAPRNVSLYQVLKLAIFGGLSAILLTLFIGKFLPNTVDGTGNLTGIGATITGLVEETAKLAIAVRMMGRRRFNWTLNGLLLGAAVGGGFAAFESAGYVLGGNMATLILRGIFTPFGHVVWTGLATAALWKVKGKRAFQWEMVKDHRFIRVFGLVVLGHILWDAPLQDFPTWDGELVKYLLIGVVGWVIVLSYIQDGLKQIRAAQMAEQLGLPDLPPPNTVTGAA